MAELTIKDKTIIIGNTILAILIIYASMNLVVIVNSHIFAALLAVIVAAWLWLVFGKHDREDYSGEYYAAEYIDIEVNDYGEFERQ